MARSVRLQGHRAYSILREGDAADFEAGVLDQQNRCLRGHELECWDTETLKASGQKTWCIVCGENDIKMHSCRNLACRYRLCTKCHSLSQEAFREKVRAEHRCELGHTLRKHTTQGYGLCCLCEQGTDAYVCSELCLFVMCEECFKLPGQQTHEMKRETLQVEYMLAAEMSTEDQELCVSAEEASFVLLRRTIWEIDVLFALRIVALVMTWMASRFGDHLLSFAIIACGLLVSIWRERVIVESFRATAEELHDKSSKLAWPWTTRLTHPRAAPQLFYFTENKRAFNDSCGPLVPYWVSSLFFPLQLTLLRCLDAPLDSFVAGAAFLSWPRDRTEQFRQLWKMVPVIGPHFGSLGPPGILTMSIGTSTLLQVAEYLRRRKYGAESAGRLTALADLSGLWMVGDAAALLGVPLNHFRRALFSHFSRTIMGSVTTLHFTVSLVSLTYDEQTHFTFAVALLSICTSVWASLKSAMECAPPVRGPPVLLIWIPLLLVLLENAARLAGIFACPSHRFSLIFLPSGCDG